MKWFDRLAPMIGRLALASEAEAGLLAEIVRYCSGAHVEIGCLWGGTAIVAALAKAAGAVITIDPMTGGWWDTLDPAVRERPTPAAVLDNFLMFDVAHKISIVREKSDPWPLPVELLPDTILIDGDHSYEGALADWRNAVIYARRYILVHDCDERHPGVQRMVEETAMSEPCWSELCRVETMIVFERVRND